MGCLTRASCTCVSPRIQVPLLYGTRSVRWLLELGLADLGDDDRHGCGAFCHLPLACRCFRTFLAHLCAQVRPSPTHPRDLTACSSVAGLAGLRNDPGCHLQCGCGGWFLRDAVLGMNSAISALEKAGKWQLSLLLFSSMMQLVCACHSRLPCSH